MFKLMLTRNRIKLKICYLPQKNMSVITFFISATQPSANPTSLTFRHLTPTYIMTNYTVTDILIEMGLELELLNSRRKTLSPVSQRLAAAGFEPTTTNLRVATEPTMMSPRVVKMIRQT